MIINYFFKIANSNILKYFKEKKRKFYIKLLAKLSFIDSKFDSNEFKFETPHNCIAKNLDSYSDTFQDNRWAYIENPIEQDFYNNLVNDWPSNNFLFPYPSEGKIQDVGFKYNRKFNTARMEANFKYMNNFPYLKNFYQYLISNHFCKRIKTFLKLDDEMSCAFISTRAAKEKGFLSFHMDGTGSLPELKNRAINIVWHINGINGSNNGGLCLSINKDIVDSWPEGLIHESKKLKNSCLIYDMTNEIGIYHGYPPMNPNTFRWVITSQYLPKSYFE